MNYYRRKNKVRAKKNVQELLVECDNIFYLLLTSENMGYVGKVTIISVFLAKIIVSK